MVTDNPSKKAPAKATKYPDRRFMPSREASMMPGGKGTNTSKISHLEESVRVTMITTGT